jgi:aldose 1-epimerase
MQTETFGTMPDGATVKLFTLSNASGLRVSITEYGAIITDIQAPDREGRLARVALGFDRLERYLAGHPFFGAVAGRVANRIARATFDLEGRTHVLAANNGRNHLHGGLKGFDKRIWSSQSLDDSTVEFRLVSEDGEEGYPGRLETQLTCRLNDRNELVTHYLATTDRPTLVNLTNHTYFNLAGAGDIEGHILELHAAKYTPSDAELIPTGELRDVAGTPFDFRKPHRLGDRMADTGLNPPGYDHNFVLDRHGHTPALAARLTDPVSGRRLEVLTDQPGVQVYTANFLPDAGIECTGGVRFGRHGGVCLETQNFPDAVHQPHFPSPILRPGEVYDRTTIFRFTAV